MKKYSLPVVYKESQKVLEHISAIVQNNLTLMRVNPNRVRGLNYFEELISNDSHIKTLQNFDGKIIGTFCNFVPEELIYAAGAIPIRLCAGFYDTIAIGENILPRDICPLIKSSVGAFLSKLPYYELCHLLILPTSCDAKKKLSLILSDYKPVWTLELPQTKNIHKSLNWWISEVKNLKNQLETFTGVKITKGRLKASIDLLHKRTEAFRRLHQLRKLNPPVISGRDVLLVIQSAFYAPIEEWIEKTNALCAELENRKKESQLIAKRKRILLTGAPVIWPNYKIINIIEEFDATVVADDLCSGTRYLYDSVEVDEWTMSGMLEAIAMRYLYPSTCPCFNQTDDRIDRILQLVNEFSCQGVIYHNLRLCQGYDMEQELVKKALLANKIPFFSLTTDYSPEDVGPLTNRVEAFLEIIET